MTEIIFQFILLLFLFISVLHFLVFVLFIFLGSFLSDQI